MPPASISGGGIKRFLRHVSLTLLVSLLDSQTSSWWFFQPITWLRHWQTYYSVTSKKVKVKVNVWICIAPRHERTSKALRYGTRSQGISQFYLHSPRSSANGMKHTCLCLPSRSWYSFTDPEGMESWVGLGWLVGYILK